MHPLQASSYRDDSRPAPPASANQVTATIDLLADWIAASVPPDRLDWFRAELDAIRHEGRNRLLRSFGLVPRRLGKSDLALPADAAARADALRPGFDPTGLSVDQAGRIAFSLAVYRDEADFAASIEDLALTADLQELVALYRGHAVFPAASLLLARAREGVRSGMRPVFEAVAHRNPYPRIWFDEAAWNQMVVKALFIGSTLDPIQGLDERANPALTATLIDYAHERWAAGRPVSAELWRCVGPFADTQALVALERVLRTGSAEERLAAVAALEACREPEAHAILSRWRDSPVES